jgi:endonuclease/exonuclease/phosphatase family metal-dependent hydrolase
MRLLATAGLLIVLPFAASVVVEKPHASPLAATMSNERNFSAVSLNLAKEASSSTIVRAIQDAPRLREADVFLLQEVWHEEGKQSVAEKAARELGYSVAFQPARGFCDQGVAIISRYPLNDIQTTPLKACDLRFRSRSRLAISANAKTPWGDVRVWNVHLDTRINAGERLEQLQPVLTDAARYSGPKLIGGDFNTNDFYWVGNVLPMPFGRGHGSSIRSAMLQHGFETPFVDRVSTFPMLRSHLDWIFVKEMKAVGASVEPAAFSDHHAIWVGATL